MPPLLRKVLYVLALGVGMVLLSALVDGRLVPALAIPPYPLRIITLAGINIILAVSLNLINGFTGQFSIGHAGFLFWAPPQAGGDRARGMARYREALELFAAEPAAERELHAWGEPDTWAFLAFAELAREPPDLAPPRAAVIST